MNTTKRGNASFLTLVVLLSTIAIASAQTESDTWPTFTIQLNAPHTNHAAVIEIKVAVSCIGQNPVAVKWSRCYAHLERINEAGNGYVLRFENDPGLETFRTLAPGQSQGVVLRSSSIEPYGFTDTKWDAHKPGRYKLWLRYATGKTPEIDHDWLGMLSSNTIKVDLK